MTQLLREAPRDPAATPHPRLLERERLWADIVARRLLAALSDGKITKIDADSVEAACDLALGKIIGRVNREKLIDHTCRRVVELASQARVVHLDARAPSCRDLT